MTGSRFAVCCLAFLTLPPVSSAQSNLTSNIPSNAMGPSPTVSARELQIPEKARKAFQKGTQRLAAKDWAGSIPEFQKAIKAFADLYEAYYKIGLAQLELQQREEAETAFRRAVELSEGRYAPALFGLGLTLSVAGEYADAQAAVRAGLDLEPLDPAGNFAMAWVLYAAQRIAEAEKSAQQAVRYNPDFAMAHLLLAQIHMRQNKQADLVNDLDAFLRLDPNGPRSAGARVIRAQAQRALEQEREAQVVAKANP
jgi:tetratricopeptide (TPR) repeat protein